MITLTVMCLTEVEVASIRCEMAVRYEEEDIPHDFPLRSGDMWCGTIDIESGMIQGWPQGKSGELSMKVCDEGTYSLLRADGTEIISKEGYVPSCIPGEYGDYVRFRIDENGQIAEWKAYCTEANIMESFFEEEE